MSEGRLPGTALVIDDDGAIRDLIALALEQVAIRCTQAASLGEGLELLDANDFGVVILDLGLPDAQGVEAIERTAQLAGEIPIVVVTAEEDLELAVRCMKRGAADYIQKPFDRARLTTSVRNAFERGDLQRRVERLAKQQVTAGRFAKILGSSKAIEQAKGLAEQVQESEVSVLLTGESGTGKELFARAMHASSRRSSGPFVVVNCGAIPEELVESELFGHRKGAFTGAFESRVGRFEEANGGTLFLDELGELPLASQVRLLRVLQERVVVPVGSGDERPVDIRVLAATNRDLREEVAEGRFREDLYYRVAVFPIPLPPLRERHGDIPLLVEAFLRTRGEESHRALEIDQEALDLLQHYAWPGNVRQLQNVVARAQLLAREGRITAACLPGEILQGGDSRGVPPALPVGELERPATRAAGVRPFADQEREILLDALAFTRWNIKEAARLLQIGRATLYRRIHSYGLQRPLGRSANESP